jgi:hypothetical protein
VNSGKVELGAIKVEEEKVFAKKPQTGILLWLNVHFTAIEHILGCLFDTYSR